MDKSIEKVINPPWFDSIRKIQSQLGLAAPAPQEFEMLRNVRELSEATGLTSLVLDGWNASNSIWKLTESGRLVESALQKLDAMRSYTTLTELARLSSLVVRQSEISKQLKNIENISKITSILSQNSDAFKKISEISNLASFKALNDLSNSPFPKFPVLAVVSGMDRADVLDESIIEIDSRITEEIHSESDFNALSEKTKPTLLYIYHYYILPVLLSCLSAYIIANAVEAKRELESVSTPREIKKFTRASSPNFDRSSLKGFRVTTVKSLHFREGPSMKSEIITTLPIGSLVDVIDKSDRSWLFVEVEIDGVMEHG